MNRDILAFGSIAIDNLMIVNKSAAPNETVPVKKYRYTYGGAGALVKKSVSLPIRKPLFKQNMEG